MQNLQKLITKGKLKYLFIISKRTSFSSQGKIGNYLDIKTAFIMCIHIIITQYRTKIYMYYQHMHVSPNTQCHCQYDPKRNNYYTSTQNQVKLSRSSTNIHTRKLKCWKEKTPSPFASIRGEADTILQVKKKFKTNISISPIIPLIQSPVRISGSLGAYQ